MRKPLIIATALAGLGIIGVTVKALAAGRYATGEAVVIKLVEREDGSAVVLLYGQTFCVPAEVAEVAKTYKEGETMPYRIDTWHRTTDGLCLGTLGTSHANPTRVQTEPDRV